MLITLLGFKYFPFCFAGNAVNAGVTWSTLTDTNSPLFSVITITDLSERHGIKGSLTVALG
jgi:hypothetical protein